MPKKKQLQKLNLVEWCDKQVAENHELIIKWDGGGDSGWCEFLIDGELVENEYTETLLSHMYDTLDYGSWAGEFSASGTASYSTSEKAFVGDDNYSETETDDHNVDILFRIPKHLWFNRIELHIEVGSSDETPQVGVELIILNGFKLDEHTDLEKQLSDELEAKVENAIQDFIDHTGKEFRSIWDDTLFEFSEGVINGDYREFTIKNVPMSHDYTTVKGICLELADINELTNEEN